MHVHNCNQGLTATCWWLHLTSRSRGHHRYSHSRLFGFSHCLIMWFCLAAIRGWLFGSSTCACWIVERIWMNRGCRGHFVVWFIAASRLLMLASRDPFLDFIDLATLIQHPVMKKRNVLHSRNVTVFSHPEFANKQCHFRRISY